MSRQQVVALHKSMRETLIYMTHLDPNSEVLNFFLECILTGCIVDTREIMLQKLYVCCFFYLQPLVDSAKA